jgi:hypothetical protein
MTDVNIFAIVTLLIVLKFCPSSTIPIIAAIVSQQKQINTSEILLTENKRNKRRIHPTITILTNPIIVPDILTSAPRFIVQFVSVLSVII